MKGVQTCALPITDLEKSSGIRSAIYNHFRDSFRSDFVNVHLGETWPPLYPCEPIRQCATLCPEGRQAEEIIACKIGHVRNVRSEEHTSELQSLMRISYAVFCLQNTTPHELCNTLHCHDTTHHIYA